MGNILALLRDLGMIPVARDFFIKFDSIGAVIDLEFVHANSKFYLKNEY